MPHRGRILRLGYLRAALGVLLIVCSALLGHVIGREPDSDAWMPLEHSLVGMAQPLAIAFTWLCYPMVLAPVGLGLLVFGLLRREWLARVSALLISLLLSWRIADAMQQLFARPRRDDWIYKHELSFSYPSSHASITMGFWAFLGVIVALSQRGSARAWVAAGTVVLCAGIVWSRLALGAHYATDLAGGICLGAGVACILSSFLSI